LSAVCALVMVLGSVTFAQAPPQTKIEEKLSDSQIKVTVDAHVADIKSCMKESGNVTGKLVLVFGVLPDGHTGDYKVKQASSNAALDKCIVAAFKRWQFPKRKAGPFQGVEYPLVFSAPKAKPQEPVGTLDRSQIEGTINGHMPEVRSCYDDALLKKADLEGVVTMDITVGTSGAVIGTKIASTTANFPSVESCINEHVKKWTFPKPQGGNVVISYPFVMKLEKKK
jgi:TonB family protein